jgi:DNA/RNA endonuclease G (NUC1)
MAGHPLANAGKFHRGHLMAHSIGGGTDINLVPQLGSLNIGAFRVLERMVRDQAKQNLRSFYFVRPIYNNASQMPSRFEQCVILPSKALFYSLHNNA